MYNIIVVEKGVYSGREGSILGGLHIYFCTNGGGGIFWEGGVDSGSPQDLPRGMIENLPRGRFWEIPESTRALFQGGYNLGCYTCTESAVD